MALTFSHRWAASSISRSSGKKQVQHVHDMVPVAAKAFVECTGVLLKRIGRLFGIFPDFDGLQATSFVHAELVAHQAFHVRHFPFIDRAVGLGHFGTEPEYMKNKFTLPTLISPELMVRLFFFLGLVKQIMPNPGSHKKADQSTKWDTQKVEQKDSGDAADDFAFDFQCYGQANMLHKI